MLAIRHGVAVLGKPHMSQLTFYRYVGTLDAVLVVMTTAYAFLWGVDMHLSILSKLPACGDLCRIPFSGSQGCVVQVAVPPPATVRTLTPTASKSCLREITPYIFFAAEPWQPPLFLIVLLYRKISKEGKTYDVSQGTNEKHGNHVTKWKRTPEAALLM